MCELFAMSARYPTTIQLSLAELARHGGQTGPHRDGWGVAFQQGGDALVLREAAAASESQWVGLLKSSDVRSHAVLAHIRRATHGERLLRNTQPFSRELGGRMHLFAHNGTVATIERDARFLSRRFRRIGDTDSEQAFCALLDRIASRWDEGIPSLDERLDVIVPFARDLRTLGPANFIYSDGDATFAHGHRRTDASGVIRPPGLHVVCRTCIASTEGPPLAGITLDPAAEQTVALVASVPLSSEAWQPLEEGEVVVLQDGKVVRRVPP